MWLSLKVCEHVAFLSIFQALLVQALHRYQANAATPCPPCPTTQSFLLSSHWAAAVCAGSVFNRLSGIQSNQHSRSNNQANQQSNQDGWPRGGGGGGRPKPAWGQQQGGGGQQHYNANNPRTAGQGGFGAQNNRYQANFGGQRSNNRDSGGQRFQQQGQSNRFQALGNAGNWNDGDTHRSTPSRSVALCACQYRAL